MGCPGIRGPSRNAILADLVEPAAYGRAYGFERAMDNFGAIIGPLLAILLVSLVGVREAILWSIVPGLLAAAAMYYAARHVPRPTTREHRPIRLQVRPVLTGRLGRLFVGMGAFEFGNAAATLMILRASELLTASRGEHAAGQIAVLCTSAIAQQGPSQVSLVDTSPTDGPRPTLSSSGHRVPRGVSDLRVLRPQHRGAPCRVRPRGDRDRIR